jgi:hypothetical protein
MIMIARPANIPVIAASTQMGTRVWERRERECGPVRWLLDEKTKKKKKNILMMRIEDGTPHVLKRVSTRVKVPTFLLY